MSCTSLSLARSQHSHRFHHIATIDINADYRNFDAERASDHSYLVLNDAHRSTITSRSFGKRKATATSSDDDNVVVLYVQETGSQLVRSRELLGAVTDTKPALQNSFF